MTMRARVAEHRRLHVARRSAGSSNAAFPRVAGIESVNDAPMAASYSGAGPVRNSLPEASQPPEGCPIWFAVLRASSCLAKANGEKHAVSWNCVSGRAVYTNDGGVPERIEPLGVSLMGGQTLAVYWMPGETAYTLEVYRQNERCA